jgi:hypothetical protein
LLLNIEIYVFSYFGVYLEGLGERMKALWSLGGLTGRRKKMMPIPSQRACFGQSVKGFHLSCERNKKPLQIKAAFFRLKQS